MAVAQNPAELPVTRADALAAQAPEHLWLVRSLWGRAAVGILGGAPKACKSWLGLDLAVSVASATPCLDRLQVDDPGPALAYLAEDSLPTVRTRIEAICRHRNVDIRGLDLHVITAPTLRLDLEADQQRLAATLDRLRPRLLVLDPLVRLHRLDENVARDMSGILGFLRGLQRTFDLAVAVVHHASKRYRMQPGQGLRGSGDLYAFGDSNAYLTRHPDHLELTVEHRAAPAPAPLHVRLATTKDGQATHLEVVSGPDCPATPETSSLPTVVLHHLEANAFPRTRTAIRAELKVNNHRLGQALDDLRNRGLARQTPDGWVAVEPPQPTLPFPSPSA